MKQLRKRLQVLRKEDRGASDIITILFLLPILLLLIFSMIDLSLYVMARSTVQGVARDGARQVAMWGGNESSLRGKASAPTANMKTALVHGNGNCKPSACTKAPVIQCTPKQTSAAGDNVSCSVTYSYRSVTGNYSLFSALTNQSFTVTQTSRAETKGLK